MASAPTSASWRLFVFGLTLSVLIIACVGSRNTFCTPIPDLYTDWARASGATDTTALALRSIVEPRRAQVERMPDVYTRLWSKSSAQLAEEGERIAWRDDSIMVVIQQSSDAPALAVVPRKSAPFLIDVSPGMRHRLAIVAAASSDALASAAGRGCEDAARTEIQVSPPDAVELRQLVVRVQPRPPVKTSEADVFYRRVEQVLETRLGGPPER